MGPIKPTINEDETDNLPKLLERLLEAIRTSRDYIYDIRNVCKTCEHSARIYKWVKAEDGDIDAIKNEIEKAYRLAFSRCVRDKQIARGYIASVFDILRAFEKTLSQQRWLVHEAARFGPGLIRDTRTNKVYYIYGWDGTRPISKKQVEKKVAVTSLKGRRIDCKVLIAWHFSKSAIRYGTKVRNTALVDLGFVGKEEWTDITIHGALDAKDPLISELLPFLTLYMKQLRKLELTSLPISSIDSRIVDYVVRAFNEYFRVTDCGHLHISERREPYLGYLRVREESSFEERLKSIGMGLYPTLEDVRKKLNELVEAYEKLRVKIDQLYRNELIFTLVKKDVDGNLRKNEICFLCKSCEDHYVNRYEIPETYPCEGARCIFKHFVVDLGERIRSSSQFIEAYDFGLLKGKKGNIVISQGRLNQPPDNILMFSPCLILCIQNFFSDKLVKRYPYRPGELRLVGKEASDVKAVAFESAMSFLIPALAYDCQTDDYAYVPIQVVTPSTAKIVERLASMEFSVKPTERAYRAAHDRIVEICRDIGLEFGFRPETEYRVGTERIDIAWLDRTDGSLEAGIEVELRCIGYK